MREVSHKIIKNGLNNEYVIRGGYIRIKRGKQEYHRQEHYYNTIVTIKD